jgi:hypothetical protein
MTGAPKRREVEHESAIQTGLAQAAPAPCGTRSATNPTIGLMRVISSAAC